MSCAPSGKLGSDLTQLLDLLYKREPVLAYLPRQPATKFVGAVWVQESDFKDFGEMTQPEKQAKSLIYMVGARGFEPPTTCTPCRYATRLRYAPNFENVWLVRETTV